MMGSRAGFAALIVLGLTAIAPRARADALYSVKGLDLTARSISNAGQVVGDLKATAPNYWTFSGIESGGVVTPITTPDTGANVTNAVISPGGTIAYNNNGMYGPDSAWPFAMVLKNGTATSSGPMGTMGINPYSTAEAVNDSGEVVGESHQLVRVNQAFASVPQSDGTYRPVSLGANGGMYSTATAVNNAGTVVGHTDVVGQWAQHAFVGGVSNGYPYMQDIGTLGGRNSGATAINDAGQVVGFSNVGAGFVTLPFNTAESYPTHEDTHAFLAVNNVMHDLGTLKGFADSEAEAINSKGVIVGAVSNTTAGNGYAMGIFSYNGDDPTRAVIFADGKVTDLNDLLPPNSGWLLQNAVGINDNGQIIGEGLHDGVEQSFLLTPTPGGASVVPEPSSLLIFGLAAGAAALARRRAV